jgi:G3E family GTPase
VIETSHSRVDPDQIFDTGLFDFDSAHEHPMWAKELYGFANHTPETEEYGISSFVYHAREPFDPAKIHAVLNGPLPGVIRAKGHFWIATRPDWVAEFSLAGAMSSVTPLGRWWASVPAERLPKHPEAQAEIASKWAEPWGDRRQEIVFIGADLDREAICAALNAALVTTCDFTPQAWTKLPDPFPQWGAKAA